MCTEFLSVGDRQILYIVHCRPKNEIGKQLAEIFDHEKSHKPIKLARSRTAAKAAQLLFKKLVEEISK